MSAASRAHWLLGLMLLLAGCGSDGVRPPRAELLAPGGPARALVPEAVGAASATARRDFRFFVAGHSLVDRPLPDFLAAATPPVPAEAARGLARHAAAFVAARAAAADPVLSPRACRAYIAESFAADYWAYQYRNLRRDGAGPVSAGWTTMKGRIQTGRILRDPANGPFRDGGELATAP